MLESWFKKAAGGLARTGLKPVGWMRMLPPGVWLAFLVIALVGGRLFWVAASRPAHRQEIANAFGSISLFYGRPQMSPDGSQFTYVATDDQGYALLLDDSVTGRRQIMFEETGVGAGDSFDLQAWPWSPDGNSFIYTTRNTLCVCANDTNLPPEKLSMRTGVISCLVWVNPLEFAWLEGEKICYAEHSVGGEWQLHRLPLQGQVLSLAAIDSHTIAWLQDGFICRLDLSRDLAGTNNPFAPLSPEADKKPSPPPPPPSSLVWLDTKMKGLTGFNYSRETGCFLISRTVNGLDSLWSLNSQTGEPTNAVLVMQGRLLRNAQWTGPGQFACLSHEPGHSGLVLAGLSGEEKERVLEHGSIWWFGMMPDRKKVLCWGTVSNELSAGIWQCDLISGELRPIAPASEFSSPYAHRLDSNYGTLKTASGRTIFYHLFFPAKFDRHKKYPVVIGSTPLAIMMNGPHGRQWAPALATCGAFVITVERTGWFASLNEWKENVMSIYQHFHREPCLDFNQAYLFGASAETQPMSELLAQSPGLWKGAIFLNPSGLPDFSKSPPFQVRPRILISTGGEEHEEARWRTFQTNALSSGVLTEIIIHPGENHHVVGNAAKLERTRALTHFVFEE